MRSSLTLLAALGAALALAGPGGGAAPAGGDSLDPDVALRAAGPGPAHGILAPFSFVVVSLERSCPPPAILACRPAIRFAGRLRDQPPPDPRRDRAGRVTSQGEVLAHWRLADGVLEVVTGGLPLQGAGAIDASAPGFEANLATLGVLLRPLGLNPVADQGSAHVQALPSAVAGSGASDGRAATGLPGGSAKAIMPSISARPAATPTAGANSSTNAAAEA